MEIDSLDNWRKTHYTNEVTPKLDGKKVTLMGWAREIRVHGKLLFVVLADRAGDCQITVKEDEVGKDLFAKVKSLNREDVIAIKGTVKATKQTKRGVEVLLSELKVLNKAQSPLPLDVAEKTPALLDTRLDNRVLDLRKPKNLAVFKIRAEILRSAREYFAENGFREIESPKIIATATEGGAELFPVSYYDKAAFLRQSPQLYKELMTACFEKVFEIGTVFRAEPSETTRHLSEVTQMDIEMGFATEEDVWEVFDGLIPAIYSSIKKNCAEELKTLGKNLKIPKSPFKRISYTDIIKEISKKGIKLKWGDDIPPEGERLITEIYKNPMIVYGYPSEMKPFYIAVDEKDTKISRGFDLIMEGLEIASGGRRIHDPKTYESRLRAKGLNPENFKEITKFYHLGMPPHAGWAIGVDRLTEVICGLQNVREAVLFPRDVKRLTP